MGTSIATIIDERVIPDNDRRAYEDFAIYCPDADRSGTNSDDDSEVKKRKKSDKSTTKDDVALVPQEADANDCGKQESFDMSDDTTAELQALLNARQENSGYVAQSIYSKLNEYYWMPCINA